MTRVIKRQRAKGWQKHEFVLIVSWVVYKWDAAALYSEFLARADTLPQAVWLALSTEVV